jgi:hypothetical protein
MTSSEGGVEKFLIGSGESDTFCTGGTRCNSLPITWLSGGPDVKRVWVGPAPQLVTAEIRDWAKSRKRCAQHHFWVLVRQRRNEHGYRSATKARREGRLLAARW